MTINKDKLITRQKLFSILTNIIDTSDVFCVPKTTIDKSIVTPNNIILMDSNENEYINNNNNNININNLQDDDELQLIVKFNNTDIDDAHAWVEKLIIQLKLENNCEIIDEGDFDENSIIAIFILDDFINDSNNINNLTDDNNIESMLITNDTLIEYNDDNDIDNDTDIDINTDNDTDTDVNDLINQIEILNQDTINNKNEINIDNDPNNEIDNINENKNKIDIIENNQENIASVVSNNDDNSNDDSIDKENNQENDVNAVSNNDDSIITNSIVTDDIITDSIVTNDIIVTDNNNVKENNVFINKNNKSLSALDILNNIDPLTGQLRYSSICNNSFIDNEENINDENINNEENEDINNKQNNINEENENINNEENNINEEDINEEEKVQVINATEVTENLNKQKLKSVKQVNPAIVATQKTKTNLKVNINSIKNNPPSQGISLRGISNRVSATTTDGRIMSAAAQVREMLDEIISKNTMTINILPLLQDVANCKKEMRLTYPLLMKVNPNLDFKDQASFGGKKRYSKKTVQYCNQEFYITNHIFVQNVSKIRSYLESLNLIDKKENTSTTEIVDKQKIIQELINQKINATGKSIPDTVAINDTKTEIKV